MKKFNKFFVLIVILSIATGIFIGCESADTDTSKLTDKPDLDTAIQDYENLSKKSSFFTAGLKITMFQSDPDNSEEIIPISFGQQLTADRIQNEEKIYMDLTLGSHFVSDNLIDMVRSLMYTMETITDNDLSMNQDINDYINGDTLFAGRLGYDGIDTYNIKGDYINKDEEPDFLDDSENPVWLATNESSILNAQAQAGFNGSISPKDYLMYSTMIDFEPENGWIKEDEADEHYNKDKEAYLYEIITHGSKFKSLIIDLINNLSEKFDEEEYDKELSRYADIFPTVASWISTPDSTANASLTKSGNLKSFSSSMRIDINIDVEEMWDIVELVMPSEYKKYLPLAKIMLSNVFVSSNGENGTWSVRIDLSTEETFSYDKDAVDLSGFDQDMFLSCDTEDPDRTEYLIQNQ